MNSKHYLKNHLCVTCTQASRIRHEREIGNTLGILYTDPYSCNWQLTAYVHLRKIFQMMPNNDRHVRDLLCEAESKAYGSCIDKSSCSEMQRVAGSYIWEKKK